MKQQANDVNDQRREAPEKSAEKQKSKEQIEMERWRSEGTAFQAGGTETQEGSSHPAMGKCKEDTRKKTQVKKTSKLFGIRVTLL